MKMNPKILLKVTKRLEIVLKNFIQNYSKENLPKHSILVKNFCNSNPFRTYPMRKMKSKKTLNNSRTRSIT